MTRHSPTRTHGAPLVAQRGTHPPRWALLFGVAAIAGCSAGVNQQLVATSTPVPSPSPAVAARAGGATPAPTVAAALATAAAARSGGDLAAATAAYDRAIAAAPNVIDLYLERAAVAVARADFVAAAADFDRAVALEPGNPAAYVGRGDLSLLLAQGEPARYQAASDDFNRALALDAAFLPARLGRARLSLDRAQFRGDPTDLERALTELGALGPGQRSAATGLVRARVLAAQGETEAARAALAAPTVSIAGDVPVDEADRLMAVASVSIAERAWDAAVEAAMAAVATDPNRWQALRLLAEAELGRGDAAAALAAAERLLDRSPEDGPGRFLRGAALLELGRVDDGKGALADAGARLVESAVYQARIAQELRRIESGAGVTVAGSGLMALLDGSARTVTRERT